METLELYNPRYMEDPVYQNYLKQVEKRERRLNKYCKEDIIDLLHHQSSLIIIDYQAVWNIVSHKQTYIYARPRKFYWRVQNAFNEWAEHYC